MRVLIDTGVWFRRYFGLPVSRSLKRFIEEEVTEFHLCPLSVAEIAFKWQRGRLAGVPDPERWVDHALENYTIELPGPVACLKAGLWDWTHGDLVDRILAAIASEKGLVLVHTDTVLKSLAGFPQRYFRNVN
jgi:PIN domain nuclease of toxin-antitoxin system